MRANITFDTLQYMEELKHSGIPENQAEALTNATSNAFRQLLEVKELTTKSDLETIHHDLQNLVDKTKHDLLKSINDSMWKTIGLLSTFQGLLLGIIGLFSYFKA